jgi:hypothetical protein
MITIRFHTRTIVGIGSAGVLWHFHDSIRYSASWLGGWRSYVRSLGRVDLPGQTADGTNSHF